MPKKNWGKNHCNACGHDWEGPIRGPRGFVLCPECGSSDWSYEGEVCNAQGESGMCDMCGCKFILNEGKIKVCPSCGSKRWDHIETDKARRLEECRPWVMEKAKGDKTYHYWMASWREGGKVRNVHLGSCKKVDHETALQKARKMKAEALGLSEN